MSNTKLDSDLEGYDERLLKLEHFLSAVALMCDLCEQIPGWHPMHGRIGADDLRDAMKGLE